MHKIFFSPGPSALYFTIEQHIKNAINQDVPSISHRSNDFKKIYQEAVDNLKQLLGIPDGYHIVFTNSATEIWEKITDNLIAENSFHFINGAFSKKFYSVATNLGKQTDKSEVPWGELPSTSMPDKSYDVIGLAHNETSTGVSFPLDQIAAIRQKHQEAILAIDAVSSLPVVDLDYAVADTVYFSVQKGFGLPAGLGIWILNDRCIEKSAKMAEKGLVRKSTHSLQSLVDYARDYQTPSTPNVLDIYLLAKVCADMLEKGIGIIRKESIYKAAIMYNMLDKHTRIFPFVTNKEIRSDTIIVANINEETETLIDFLRDKKLIIGAGYGAKKDKQIRIANFPTHSKEQFEQLTDLIEQW